MSRRPKGSGGVRNRGSDRTPRYEAYFWSEASGDRRRVTKGGFRRKADAEAWVAEQLRLEGQGRTAAPSKMTVGEMLDTWLEVKGPTWSEGYWDTESSIVRSRLVPSLGHIGLTSLQALQVERALSGMRAGTAPSSPGCRAEVSETYLQHVYDTLNKAMKWAEKRRLLGRNVVVDVDRPRRDTEEMLVWTGGELAMFLAEIEGEYRSPFFHLAAFTGMRRSELLRLPWRLLNLDEGRLHVHKAKTPTGIRWVDLDPLTVRVMRAWRGQQKRDRLAFGPAYTKTDQVFTAEDGVPLTKGQIRSTWDRFMDTTAAPQIRFHDLRHTHASLLLAAREPVPLVAKRLGDTSTTIMSTYAHAIPGDGKAMAERFASMVDGGHGDGLGG